MGFTNYSPSADDVKSWIKMTDVNDDGKISLDEYEFLVLKSLEKAGIKIEYMWSFVFIFKLFISKILKIKFIKI